MEQFFLGAITAWFSIAIVIFIGDWQGFHKSGIAVEWGWAMVVAMLPAIVVFFPFFLCGHIFTRVRWKVRIWRNKNKSKKT